MINTYMTRTFAGALALLAAFAVGACDDVVSPEDAEDQFLLRIPVEYNSYPSFFWFQSTSTDSMTFQWEPADEATRYDVVMWKRETLAELRQTDRAALDPASANLTFPIDQFVELTIPFEFFVGGELVVDSTRTVDVVEAKVPHADLSQGLIATGTPLDASGFYLWSVVAETPDNRRFRSIEVQSLELYHF